MEQMTRLLLIFSMVLSPCVAETIPWRPFHAMLHSMIASSSATKANNTAVDEQLYSRQLLVYGKSAQHRMQDAHVLVIGESPLTAEIVKNLALAGVGRISIHGNDGSRSDKNIPVKPHQEKIGEKEWNMEIDEGHEGKVYNVVTKGDSQQNVIKSESRLLGDATDLASYARGLNPYIKASHVDIKKAPQDVHDINDYTVIIMVDAPFKTSINLQKAYPGITKKAKIISCSVQGVCSYIMNDFGEHHIEDADGEEVKVIIYRPQWSMYMNSCLLSFKIQERSISIFTFFCPPHSL